MLKYDTLDDILLGIPLELRNFATAIFNIGQSIDDLPQNVREAYRMAFLRLADTNYRIPSTENLLHETEVAVLINPSSPIDKEHWNAFFREADNAMEAAYNYVMSEYEDNGNPYLGKLLSISYLSVGSSPLVSTLDFVEYFRELNDPHYQVFLEPLVRAIRESARRGEIDELGYLLDAILEAHVRITPEKSPDQVRSDWIGNVATFAYLADHAMDPTQPPFTIIEGMPRLLQPADAWGLPVIYGPAMKSLKSILDKKEISLFPNSFAGEKQVIFN